MSDSKHAIPFGSAAALIQHNAKVNDLTFNPTTQDIAIVVCGGGDPFAEYESARSTCEALGLKTTILVGNDMIGVFPGHVDHAVSLHPDKLLGWLAQRREDGFNAPPRVWAHRNYLGTTDWTRDWSGSTGLMCVKIARELGHTHVVLCGVPMTVDGLHFLRKERWDAAHGFRRGWINHIPTLKPYVRSYGGWTADMLGVPTVEWLRSEIADENRYDVPGESLKA